MLRRLLRVGAALAATGLCGVALVLWAYRFPLVAVPAQADVAFVDVTVVNPGGGRDAHRTVTVAGDRIASIADAGAGGAARFAGTFVLPGLIDMHVHHPPGRVVRDVRLFDLLYLAHGVTSVRDTGGFDDSIWTVRREIEQGSYPGPRIFACGPFLDGDPPVWPGSRVVRTAADARAAVAAVAAAGADCVKVYERIAPDVLAAVRAAAAERRLPVVGHVPGAVPFEAARLADVQHLTGVAPGPRSVADFVAQEAAAWRALDDARIDFVVRTSRAQGIAHTPTLVVWQRMAALADPAALRADPTAHLLPRYYREIVWHQDPRLGFRALEATLPKRAEVVRRLHDAGVRIHAGTDTLSPFVVPGASLHEELRLLVQAGLTPEEAWVAATRDAGVSLGRPGLGTVAVGAPADLLVFRADPTRDLANLGTLEGVVAQGRFYPRAMLDAAVARYRAAFDGPVADAVSMALTRLFAGTLPKPQ
ncbi:MAG: amidohydrolase family protein [Candidatus Binatia bacterium]